MRVLETFFSVGVADMKRACGFYEKALGAEVAFGSSGWSSLRIAGVRVGLGLDPAHRGVRTGLHFVVADLTAACADVGRAGGRVVNANIQVAPGVFVADVTDSEGNTFTLTKGEA